MDGEDSGYSRKNYQPSGVIASCATSHGTPGNGGARSGGGGEPAFAASTATSQRRPRS
jgi:hypothetical protein